MAVTVEEVFSVCDLDSPTTVQIDYANRVMASLECSFRHDGGEVMLEAETGVGKTVGYLIPAALKAIEHGGRVIVSTYTKSLQKQVIEDAGKIINGIRLATGKTIHVARLIGKTNFFDIDRVRKFRDDLEAENAPTETLQVWNDLISWNEAPDSSGEIQDYLEEAGGLPGDIPPGLVCLDSASGDEAKARYCQHVNEALGADILVTNHAMLCIASMRRANILHADSDLRPVVAVIVDEADRLPDAARNLMTDQAPLMAIQRVVKRLSDDFAVLSEANATAIMEALEGLRATVAKIEKRNPGMEAILFEDLDSSAKASLEQAAITFIGAVDQCKDELCKAYDDPQTHELVVDLIRYRGAISQAVVKGPDAAMAGVLQYSPSRRYPSIALAQLYPARVVKSLLEYLRDGARGDEKDARPSAGTALVLTSATLSGSGTSSGDKFWEMKVQMGIFDKENACGHLHASFSPRKFGNIEKVVLADPSVPKPYKGLMDEESETVEISDEWVAYAAKMVVSAAKEGGYTLALVGSYRVAARIAIEIKNLGYPHVVQKMRAEHLNSTIGRLKERDDGVFITPGGWEGLNARGYGFSWRSVVICQIPLARADSAHKEALIGYHLRKGKSRAEAESIIYGETMSAAFRKMRQGIGRGIRSATDSFSLWIADPRVPPYGTVIESDEPIPQSSCRTMPLFTKCVPQRFREVETHILLKDGGLIS